MAGQRLTIIIRVRVAWWWWAYVTGVQITSAITGRQPDPLKVMHWASRAVTAKVTTRRE